MKMNSAKKTQLIVLGTPPMLRDLPPVSHVIPHQAMKALVESLALSIVGYCVSVYGSYGPTKVRKDSENSELLCPCGYRQATQ